jgi:polyhydroxyalkanoate synthesis regulator phasin
VDRHGANATLSGPVTPSSDDEKSGISDSLRNAIESTFAATAGSATETRERAGELLDEVARRGRDARSEVTTRAQEAREGVASRAQGAREEAVRKTSEASADVVHRVDEELRSISERLARLESSLRSPEANPQPKGEG